MASKLIDGCIPANTVCPYRGQCVIAMKRKCTHFGGRAKVPYSCAAARTFDMENAFPVERDEDGNIL
jgi:hypothetical protein